MRLIKNWIFYVIIIGRIKNRANTNDHVYQMKTHTFLTKCFAGIRYKLIEKYDDINAENMLNSL